MLFARNVSFSMRFAFLRDFAHEAMTGGWGGTRVRAHLHDFIFLVEVLGRSARASTAAMPPLIDVGGRPPRLLNLLVRILIGVLPEEHQSYVGTRVGLGQHGGGSL